MDIILYSVIALGVLGLSAGWMLSYAARRFTVTQDPRFQRLIGAMPGINCGACGYASCAEAAKAIIEGAASVNICVAGGKDTAEKAAEITGRRIGDTNIISRIAVVQCKGGKSFAKDKFEYIGVENCSAALLIAGGPKACAYGCLGFGTCAEVCPFDAITMSADRLPVIDENKCTGCGKCAEACPRNIIVLIPRAQKVYLGCVSQDKARAVRDVCKAGCIACGLCARPNITSEGLITMDNNLPQIHWQKDKDLKELLNQAVAKCPSKCFVVRQ